MYEKSLLQKLLIMSKYAIYCMILHSVAFSLALANDGEAQTKKLEEIYISMDIKNSSLEEALNEIEEKSDFMFVYNDFKVKKNLEVKFLSGNKSLSEILLELSKEHNIKFKRIDQNIFVNRISRNDQRIEDQVGVALMEDVNISGKVTDENGEGLPGASVVVKGTTTGTTSNLDGNYNLTAPEDAILTVSFVGYLTQEISLAGRSTIDVQMALDAETLDEIVVIGYGSRSKKDLTGSVGQIESSEITKGTSMSPQMAMQGRMSGVLVSSPGGDPNRRPEIRIRGVGTLGNNDPLFVIDGVPITEWGQEPVYSTTSDGDLRTQQNIFNLINPNDIESISVLKDASSAAIYGVRAANGVVLITTKKGKSGTPKVSFDMSVGVQNIPKTFDMLNTQQYAALYQEAFANNGPSSGNMPSQLDPTSPDYLGDGPTYDWQDNMLNKNAQLQNYNVSISGGNASSTYFMGAGYTKSESPIRFNSQDRYTITLNSDHQLNKWLKIGQTFRFGYVESLDERDDGSDLVISRWSPWQPIFGDVGGYAPIRILDADYNGIEENLYGPMTRQNVFGRTAYNEDDYSIIRNLGSAYVEIQPIDGLKIKTSLSADYSYNKHIRWKDREIDHFLVPEDTRWNAYTERHLRNANLTSEVTINYHKSIGEHTVDLTLNGMNQKYSGEVLHTTNWNLPSNTREFRRIYGTNLNQNSGSVGESYALQGYMGRASYNLSKRYYVDATIRRDGSSKFAKAYRWGTFPSLALAWRISEEAFLQDVGFINNLKLRGGWGRLGNQAIPAYQFLSTVNNNAAYPIGTGPGVRTAGAFLPGVPVEDLTWEISESTTVAFDGIFFNNKLDLTVEYFSRYTKDILQQVPVPKVIGAIQSPYQNIAAVSNRGMEFSANYQFSLGDLDFSFGGNFTTVKNTVEELYNNEPLGGDAGRIELGRPLNFLNGYKMVGIFQTPQEVTDFQSGTTDPGYDSQKSPGDIQFADLYGNPTEPEDLRSEGADGTINSLDKDYIGKTIPGYYYGFNLNANYKGFDFYIFFQGIGDVQKVNYSRWDGEGMIAINAPNQWTSTLDRWTPENPSTTMPRAVYADPSGNGRFSSRWVENAGFMRIRTMQIGYTLPSQVLSKLRASNLRIYLSANNLATFTKWKGTDPENDLVPVPRVFTFGVNATF